MLAVQYIALEALYRGTLFNKIIGPFFGKKHLGWCFEPFFNPIEFPPSAVAVKLTEIEKTGKVLDGKKTFFFGANANQGSIV